MKRSLLPYLVLASAIGTAYLPAQTTWTGATNSALNNAGNWDNGLPASAGNAGTIPAGAGSITHSFNLNGYFVTQNGGTLTSSVAFSPSNGSWTLNDGGSLTPGVTTSLQNVDDGHQDLIMNGGTFGATQLNVSSTGTNRSASFTMSGGTATLSGRLDINAGGSVTINGGSLTAASNRMNDVSTTLTINGGVIDLGTEFGRSGSIFMNGGATTADSLSTYAGFSMTFGGTTAGSLTVDALGGSFMPPNRNFNWLPGSQMSFTVVTGADWAETEWNAGRMFYNGDDDDVLGDWATVNGTIFAWDGGTNTLSLVPEPSSSALLGMAGGLVLLRRRRRQ